MKYTMLVLFLGFFALAGEPDGFQDPAVLEKVLAGDIVQTQVINTETEFRTVIRSYFHKVSPEAFVALATNHAKFPDLFEEIKEAKTLKVNADATQWDYQLKVTIPVGPFSQTVTPEVHQVLLPAADAASETRMTQKITNYKEMIRYSSQVTRLIPYKGGMLVLDDVHFVLTKDAAQGGVLKKKLQSLFNRYTQTFREELGGAP